MGSFRGHCKIQLGGSIIVDKILKKYTYSAYECYTVISGVTNYEFEIKICTYTITFWILKKTSSNFLYDD